MQRFARLNRRAGKAALVGVTLLASLAVPGSDVALAAPPTATDFQIYYYITNRDGSRGRLMSGQDMQTFVNQARCECEQKIITRLTFQGGSVDPDQVNAYVGQNCADAQKNGGFGQFAPCAQLTSGAPLSFQTGPESTFAPIFLGYGVTGSQGIAEAEVDGTCSGIQGEGGIWMCSGVNTCQSGEFFMQGMTNFNTAESGIVYDFQAPVSPPTNFSLSAGDEAVNIKWDVTAVPEAGYRVLCADENGDPIGSSHAAPLEELREAVSVMDNSIYYTANNICPDGVFGENYGATGDGDGDATGDGDGDATGDGDGDATGDGDGDTGDECIVGEDGCACDVGDLCIDGLTCDLDLSLCVATDCVEGDANCPCIDGTTCTDDTYACADTGLCEFVGCTPGESGCSCTAEGTCVAPASCDESSNQCLTPTSGIETLDWSYVCSSHLGYVTSEARIDGLENGKEYTFIVVAYDKAGNAVASEPIVGTPIETRGLWEECEAQGNICGEAWNCSVSEGPNGLGWWLGGLGLGLFGLGLGVRRRRRA